MISHNYYTQINQQELRLLAGLLRLCGEKQGNHQATDRFFVVIQQAKTTYEVLVVALHEMNIL